MTGGDKDGGRAKRKNGRRKHFNWAKLREIAQKRVIWVIVTLSSLVAGTAAFISQFEQIKTYVKTYWDNRVYLQTLHHPYPEMLKEEQVAKWKSGEIGLAQLQIDGYLGRLTGSADWIKLCLTSSGIFPEKQFNERLKLDETFTDRQNKLLLQQRLDRIDMDKIEDGTFLRINDPFARLLERSSIQLLSRYQKSELSLLDGAQLYLLRNAMFGRHGYPFDTAKLFKFQNRMGWGARRASYTPEAISKVERCNAFLLQELHRATELGALGRGVLIREPKDRSIPKFLRAALCTCLAQPKTHVECRESPDATNETEFREYVDLIIEFVTGDANSVAWTFIDERQVVQTDRDPFAKHRDKFYSAALDFNTAVLTPFQSKKIEIKGVEDSPNAGFWGVRVMLDKTAIATLSADPMLTREVAQKMCAATRDALELTGPYLPRIADLSAATTSIGDQKIEVLQMPIVFDDRRIELTRRYVLAHDGVLLAEIEFVPQAIVIHSTNTDTLQSAFGLYKPSLLPAPHSKTDEPEVNLSMHYLVDRDGAIYSLMKDFFIARHVPGVNRFAIGIANVGSANQPLTESQVSANVALIGFLKRKYKLIRWVASASDLSQLRTLPIWEEKQPDPALPLLGPGEASMSKLSARLNAASQ